MMFLRRIVGAAMFDAAIYEELENDRKATLQSLMVVVLSSLAAGIGATGIYDTAATLRFFAVGSMLSLSAWILWALLIFQIGGRLLPASETDVDIGQLLRTLGFAASPGLIQVFAVLPGMLVPVFAIAITWTIAGSVVAIRHALDYKTLGRAIAVAGLAWLLALVFVVGIGVLFEPSLAFS